MAQQPGDEAGRVTRPAVLTDLTETQLQELERQFDEGDRAGFDVRAESYGWTADVAQAVWDWLGRRPQVAGS